MITYPSPLYELPRRLGRKEVFFLDGLRHAAQIAEFAYGRLQDTLCEMVDIKPQVHNRFVTAAFLDAWAVVDAIEKFRDLWQNFPDGGQRTAKNDDFLRLTDRVREIRNIGQHLPNFADKLLEKNAPALGVLTWITFQPHFDPPRYASCVILPGHAVERQIRAVHPEPGINYIGRTPQVMLYAGTKSVSLPEMLVVVKNAVRLLESQLPPMRPEVGPPEPRFPADHFMHMEFSAPGIAHHDPNVFKVASPTQPQ